MGKRTTTNAAYGGRLFQPARRTENTALSAGNRVSIQQRRLFPAGANCEAPQRSVAGRVRADADLRAAGNAENIFRREPDPRHRAASRGTLEAERQGVVHLAADGPLVGWRRDVHMRRGSRALGSQLCGQQAAAWKVSG